jgi:Glycosyltransferase family 18
MAAPCTRQRQVLILFIVLAVAELLFGIVHFLGGHEHAHEHHGIATQYLPASSSLLLTPGARDSSERQSLLLQCRGVIADLCPVPPPTASDPIKTPGPGPGPGPGPPGPGPVTPTLSISDTSPPFLSQDEPSDDNPLGATVVAPNLPPVVSDARVAQSSTDSEQHRVLGQEVRQFDRRALIFTMDSLAQYVGAAAKGGPAGEIKIRRCLETGLRALGIETIVAHSDAEFFAAAESIETFDFVFVDPWTLVGPDWKPRAFLRGREHTVIILSFFGKVSLDSSYNMNLRQVWTPYPMEGNSFLGFFMDASEQENQLQTVGELPTKLNQGVFWGKDPKYFQGKRKLLDTALSVTKIHTTVRDIGVFGNPQPANLDAHSVLTPPEWGQLLASSKFVIGLGHPILGPSALDALAVGTVYINPVYDTPQPTGDQSQAHVTSQHPFAAEFIGAPYVCNFQLSRADADVTETGALQLQECIQQAQQIDTLAPFIPKAMLWSDYLPRLQQLVDTHLARKPNNNKNNL